MRAVAAKPQAQTPNSVSQASLRARGLIQTKLRVGQAGDAFEQEAERASARVMGMPQPRPLHTCACGGTCADCRHRHDQLQMQRVSGQSWAPVTAPTSVHAALSAAGQPLDGATRGFMEPRFGHDFSQVRVHTDPEASASARDVNALAYTVGRDIVFGAGAYAPGTTEGQRLIAHELAHVVQQRDTDQPAALQRFELSEKPKIAPTFGDMLKQVRELIDAATTSGLLYDDLNMDFLVEIAGGTSASRGLGRKLGSKQPTIKSRLLTRYLFTCRCGLIDMRHFFETLYISNFAAGFEGMSQAAANRYATRKGREHELEAPDAQSRFAAEDTPSNALGAFTNIGLAARPRPEPVYDAIKDTLTLCDPVNFGSLSAPSQDTIVHYYGDRVADPTPKKPGDVIPKAQSEIAVPAVLGIKECGSERSFPFSLDTKDSDLKTLGGKDFAKGSTDQTKGSEIRDFIHMQRQEVLKALPTSEKFRMLKVLLGGKVRDDDLVAAERLGRMMTAAEKAAWEKLLPLGPDD